MIEAESTRGLAEATMEEEEEKDAFFSAEASMEAEAEERDAFSSAEASTLSLAKVSPLEVASTTSLALETASGK